MFFRGSQHLTPAFDFHSIFWVRTLEDYKNRIFASQTDVYFGRVGSNWLSLFLKQIVPVSLLIYSFSHLFNSPNHLFSVLTFIANKNNNTYHPKVSGIV